MTLATQAVQMHGGYGYTREFAVERHFRDASVVEGGAQSSEEDRLTIAERLLREVA
jgi:alkylation response protein AidB-like acyl-CoA dehydrogenase